MEQQRVTCAMAVFSSAMGAGPVCSNRLRSTAFLGDASLGAAKRAAPLQQRAALQVGAMHGSTREVG